MDQHTGSELSVRRSRSSKSSMYLYLPEIISAVQSENFSVPLAASVEGGDAGLLH